MEQNTIDNMMNFADIMSNNESLKPLMDLITEIMNLPDEGLNETNVDVIIGMIHGAFTNNMKQEMVRGAIENFREEGYTRAVAREVTNRFKNEISNLIEELQPSEHKRPLLNAVFEPIYEVFDEALDKFNLYSIELPILLDEGAQMPQYAHETDACADLYLAEDTTVPAHTMSNILPTGVHIALPEGWIALIFPRSSIGFKTSLRLSNSVGIIDEEYRGALGVLYDNVSDSDVTFKKGDRIAQMLVMPSYKFKGIPVDQLPSSNRGEGGFGSTGQ